jgi:hypothetical protein
MRKIMNLNRLRRMSASEIAHRFREQLRRESDKLRLRAGHCVDDDPELDALIQQHGASLKRYFLNGPARRFYASTQEREAILRFFVQKRPEWLSRAIEQADTIAEHRMNLLGYSHVPLGSSIDWHRDPISGCQWSRRYWADYDLVHSPPADAKIIHELNRHQHLPRLAKAFFLTGQEAYAREALDQIESWIDQNPTWYGINWQSSLEIAIRSISWLWTIFLLLPSESLDDETLRRFCRSLFAQLDHVYRYPSLYTSPNTHLIGEATALFIAGILFPELPRAAGWRAFGTRTLIDEMKRQVLNDGVYGELSSYYQCYATDFYLHVLTIGRRNEVSFPDWVWSRVRRMLEFALHITHPDGTIPLLGDDDGGRVLAIASENYGSYRDGLCSGAVLFGRSDFKYQANDFSEDSLWLLGPQAWAVFDALDGQQPVDLRRAFENGGYFVQRSGWGAKDTQVIFDCGGLGFGSGGHSHADALSMTVFSGGREFLIDPGTSVYNGAPEWRRFFRSTAAHNTVLIDGASQSEPSETFRWKTKTAGRLVKQISLADFDYLDGVVPSAVAHRRRIIHVRPDYWIVLDDLQGLSRAAHDFDFLYHFAPGIQLTVMSDENSGEIDCRATIDDVGLQLCMYASETVRAEALCGQTDPIQGWASRVYGERHASPVLKASVHAPSPVLMMSFLVPGNQTAQSQRFKSNTTHAIAAGIRGGDYDDIAVMTVEDGDLHFMEYEMRGEFFLLRLEAGTIRRLVAVNAFTFRHVGETIFDSNDMIPYVQVFFWENGIVIERGEQEGKVYVRDMRDRQFQR